MSHRKIEFPRDRLLGLLRRADVRSPAALADWLSHHLNMTGLMDEWKIFKDERIPFDPIKCVQGPTMKDYFIVLMYQHRWFTAECVRLQRQVDEHWYERTEGTLALGLWRALAKDETTRTKLDAEMKQRRGEFRQQKQQYKTEQELAESKRMKELRRGRAPNQRSAVNWCVPMPLFNESEPFGYCQATAQPKKKVLAILNTKPKAKPAGFLKRPGRGRRMKLYSVTTNLRVLDVWFGKWLSQEPTKIVDAIMDTFCWQATESATVTDVRHFRALLYKHWLRISERLIGSALADESAFFEKAMTDNAAWQQFVSLAKAQRAAREEHLASRALSSPVSSHGGRQNLVTCLGGFANPA